MIYMYTYLYTGTCVYVYRDRPVLALLDSYVDLLGQCFLFDAEPQRLDATYSQYSALNKQMKKQVYTSYIYIYQPYMSIQNIILNGPIGLYRVTFSP